MSDEDRYRYFGRTGGVTLCEIYRCPNNDLSLVQQKLEDVQIASIGGRWLAVKNLDLVHMDVMTGWFDTEDDELSYQEVREALEKWNRDGWPK